MLTTFEWVALICILLVTFAGGYMPLFRPERARRAKGFQMGQAFAAGVFLALALTIMLPAAFHFFHKVLPGVDYPIASVITIVVFLSLLALEHFMQIQEGGEAKEEGLSSRPFPIIMTVMIAIPSFFLGTALGISDGSAAVMIFVAIMAHKGTAGFALALKMVRSTLTRKQTFLIFSLFAFSTPLGIIVGQDVLQYLAGYTMLVIKATILSLAAGTFLYMSTLHELRHTPLIENCCNKKGFFLALCGFVVTALVRLLLGTAQHT